MHCLNGKRFPNLRLKFNIFRWTLCEVHGQLLTHCSGAMSFNHYKVGRHWIFLYRNPKSRHRKFDYYGVSIQWLIYCNQKSAILHFLSLWFLNDSKDGIHDILRSHSFVNFNIESVRLIFSSWSKMLVHLYQHVPYSFVILSRMTGLNSLSLTFPGQVQNKEHQL